MLNCGEPFAGRFRVRAVSIGRWRKVSTLQLEARRLLASSTDTDDELRRLLSTNTIGSSIVVV